MRILGIDYGEKRIGIAVSDPLGLTAQAVAVIGSKGLSEDISEIKKLIEKYEVKQIVLGLPRTMKGAVGPQAQKVLEFAGQLEKELNLPVITWDERLSTVAAGRTLKEAEVKFHKGKKVIDKLAAAFMLQGYLDRKSP